jgi:hypothetical protein
MMTLLISTLAAIVATVIWYKNVAEGKNHQFGMLSLIYWGASLMWFVDAIFEYAESGADYFEPTSSAMLNDSFLGLSVVVFGLLIWLVRFLIKDSENVFKKILFKKTSGNFTSEE